MTIAIEVNCTTGEVIERPLTADEIAANEAAAAQAEAARLEEEAAQAQKAAARQEILNRLGLTTEEAAILLS